MRTRFRTFIAAGAMALAALTLVSPPLRAQSTPLDKAVRKGLRDTPNYGVFDLLSFKTTPDGAVTIGGYVVKPQLKIDAERAVKSVAGVTHIDNKIEVSPVNTQDDEIRQRVYNAIYHDTQLARYGTAADEAAANRRGTTPWGDRFREFGEFRSARWGNAPYFGYEPVGNYAIHILVKSGTVTLVGVVDNGDDKKTAEISAAKVSGVLGVNNDLHVSTPAKSF